MSLSPTPRQPMRSRPLAMLLVVFVVVLLIVLQNLDESPGTSLIVIGVVWFLIWTAKRLWTRSAEDVLATDRRPPVLYLRSFQLDGRGEPIGYRFSKHRLARGPLALVAKFLDAGGDLEAKVWGRTVETAIVNQLKKIGPVVAIGRPRESVPELGAARIYVSDAEWKSKVLELIKRAAVVVIQPSTSSAVFWEIREALSLCDPRRVVLLLFGMTAEKYAVVHQTARSEGVELPEPTGRRHGESIIVFDENRWSRFATSSAHPKPGADEPSLLDEIGPFVQMLRTQISAA